MELRLLAFGVSLGFVLGDIGGLAVGDRGESYKYGWGFGLISHPQECCTTHALNNM